MEAGVTLVSATKSIAETPSGMLLHRIMSSIAEFYSKNLTTEVSKGLRQKVATGGTPMRTHRGLQRSQTRCPRARAPHRGTRPAPRAADQVGVRGVRER
ncbi:recombinase family protein [Pseudoclavibacter sp. CFCC 13611]|nr:recombinase family protein [Pseudoclavibacter sp. CFCC 13611]